MKRLQILVTGGTGFLGKYVMPLLAADSSVHATGLSRSQPETLRGDLTKWDGGIDASSLRGAFDVLLHMAGHYDLRATQEEAFLHNIAGTHNALSLAQKAEIPHIVHISTVAVTMSRSGQRKPLGPEELDVIGDWPDAYAESKAHAEKIVRSWDSIHFKSRLILRLGVLTGDTQGGAIPRIDGPYHTVESFQRLRKFIEKIPGPVPLPGRRGRRLPMVPVDRAAEAIVSLLLRSRKEKWEGTKSLYVVSDRGPTAEELFRSTFRHIGLPRDVQLLSELPYGLVKSAAEKLTGLPAEELEYVLRFPRFDLSETRSLLGAEWCPEFSDYEAAFWRGYESYVQNR